ncbi:MAG: SGNH/GDSL hydrolase family protein [Acidobacteriota bacterium]
MPGARAKRFLFAVTAVALGLAAVEFGLRMAGYRPLPVRPVTSNQEILYQYGKFRASRTLIWELVPGWNGREGYGTVNINSLGLREREFSPAKSDGVFRVLCVGDSVTFGHWVEAEQAFPRRLEALLQRGSSSTIQVINAGVPGYSPFQELAWLREKGWDLKPDLVVVGFVLNDVVERFMTLAAYGGANTTLGVDTTATLAPLHRWLRRTAFFRFVISLLRRGQARREVYSVRRLFDDPLLPRIDAAWRRTESELDKMVMAARQRKVPLCLVVFPFRFQIAEKADPRPQQRLKSWAEAAGVPLVDLTRDFQRLGAGRAFLDQDHPTPSGHLVAAQAIAKAIRRHGWLGGDAPFFSQTNDGDSHDR